jgi:hypothetical protein
MDDDAAADNPDMTEVVALLGKIADDPYQYETHVAYISLLRKIGASDDLREARQFFHSIFPFSEGMFCHWTVLNWIELWVQWLEDEEKSATSSDDLLGVLNLYEQAQQDYLCTNSRRPLTHSIAINIWSRYLDFVEGHVGALATAMGIDVDQVLDLSFKKAIAGSQYHIPEVHCP